MWGIAVEISVNVPFFGFNKITSVHGDLRTGLRIPFNIAVASGTAILYLKNGSLWIDFNFKAFGRAYRNNVFVVNLS